MSMLLQVLAATEGEEHLRELPMPPYGFALIALGVFALLLAVLWAFRGTALKIAHGDLEAEIDDHGLQASGLDHR